MKAECTHCHKIGKRGAAILKHRGELLCWPCTEKIERNKSGFMGSILRRK